MALGKRVLRSIEEVNDIVEQTYYYEQKIFELSKKIEANKEIISKGIGKKTKLEVKADERLFFTAFKDVEVKLDFYKSQLAKCLTKEQYNKSIDKTVVIDDVNGLIKMLKEYDVPPKEFKKYISIIESVNQEKIENLIEMGEIEIQDLQGCYKATFNEKISIKKSSKDPTR